jgi:hypothetical protein
VGLLPRGARLPWAAAPGPLLLLQPCVVSPAGGAGCSPQPPAHRHPPTNAQKRRQRPPSRVRLYRIAPHCAGAAAYLVPKAVAPAKGCDHPDCSALDARGCFVVHLPDRVYLWQGRECVPELVAAGQRAAAQLSTYEGAPAAQLVQQGGCVCGCAHGRVHAHAHAFVAATARADGRHSAMLLLTAVCPPFHRLRAC